MYCTVSVSYHSTATVSSTDTVLTPVLYHIAVLCLSTQLIHPHPHSHSHSPIVYAPQVCGHTAPSRLSKDNGIATSNNRATAVCLDLSKRGIDTSSLHPVGYGCYRPLSDPNADPRRVEIHILLAEKMLFQQRKIHVLGSQQAADDSGVLVEDGANVNELANETLGIIRGGAYS